MTGCLAFLPFIKIGWTVVQFLWISTFVIGISFLVLKLLDWFSSNAKYLILLGAMLLLAVLPVLLLIEHSGVLPPIGLADWSLQDSSTGITREPLFAGLPTLEGISLGNSIYYYTGVVWHFGALVLLGYYIVSSILVNLYCSRLQTLNNSKVQNCIRRLAGKLDISFRYRLRKIKAEQSPAVAGTIRPYILLPENLLFDYTESERESLLMHELIHIKRSDYLIALLQRLLCSILFFQPLIWWLSCRIDRERELACDESVIRVTKNPYQYANALLKVHQNTQPIAGRIINMGENNVVRRIKKLAHKNSYPESKFKRNGKYAVAFLLILGILFTASWSSYHLHYSHSSPYKDTELGYKSSWNQK